MATSGSVNFSMSRNEIVSDAFAMIGVLGEDETLQTSTLNFGTRALNRLIKHLENKAMHVWKRSEAILFLQQDQAEYVIGSGGSAHATESYTSTTLSADEASGQTVLSVSSVTGINTSDNIGIVLDDGSIHWSTVNTVGASTVTINSALTDDATSGNAVYVYTTAISKPIKIYSVRRYEHSSEIETPINIINYEEYQNLPYKTIDPGTVIQCTYDRKINNGKLFVWPAPANTTYALKFTYAKPLEDFDNASDTPDAPQEWYHFLVTALAKQLAHAYGKTGTAAFRDLKEEAMIAEQEVLAFDTDDTYITIVPDIR